MQKRIWMTPISCILSISAGLLIALAFRAKSGDSPQPAASTDDDFKRFVYESIKPLDEKGFERLGPPKAGEWLASFPEIPQTFARYQAAAKVRPTDKRKTIVLQPLGTVTEEQTKVMEAMREYTEIFFQMPARLEKPIEITPADPKIELKRTVPAGHRHGTYDKQYSANKILDQVLIPHLPEDAVVYLGITMEDLWADDLNYVFGLGSMNQRVGVYSLCRYYPEFWGQKRKEGDETLGLLRSCKVLNHETGHMFGLSHCVFYHCSMNGSNNLGESDRAPAEFCPLCHRKLMWNIGFEPTKRFEQLQAFYAKYGMKDEAEWTANRLKNWKQLTTEAKAPREKEE
jgi:archaemetzincin